MSPTDAEPDNYPSPAEARRRMELWMADLRRTPTELEVSRDFLAGRPVAWPEGAPIPPRPGSGRTLTSLATLAKQVLALDREREARGIARPWQDISF